MKNLLTKIFIVASLPFLAPSYILAYLISHLLKLKGREDMPTIKEWFGLIPQIWKESEVV